MDTKDIIKKIAKVHEATPDEISAVIKTVKTTVSCLSARIKSEERRMEQMFISEA